MDIDTVPGHVVGEAGRTAPVPSPRTDAAGARFDAIYETYRLLLRRLAVRRGIPVRDADDLVHDVFATYLANAANVRDVHGYLIGAICNAARQYQRRERAAPFCDGQDVCAVKANDDLLDGVIANLVIRAALARLGSSCRETLQRFFLLGETAVSIAESRETSPNYIRRLLNYCRNRVRSIYLQMES
ncbi:MAG TPA: sigma-70 family RNA polymerase sigma factor [Thermoanaerobaculia bacterium]|jgi:RNA polymerase sigma factor (sigma-70 family)